jgi:hypothetical protein
MTTTTKEKDYLVIAYIMAGSCFGRASDKTRAIEICRQEANGFVRSFGGFKKGTTLTVNVFDVTGHDQVTWDDFGVKGDGPEPLGKPEIVKLDPLKKYKAEEARQ